MDKYNLGEVIGKGSFSVVCAGYSKFYPEADKVAIKIEKVNAEINSLTHECKILLHLSKVIGVVKMHYYTKDEVYRYLVLDYYKYSFQDDVILKLDYKAKQDLYKKTLQVLQNIHSKNIIHCDIKPANIMCRFGGGEAAIIQPVFIDFGMAHVSSVHIKSTTENEKKMPAFGSLKFMSIRMHEGKRPLFEDDIESLEYVFFYLFNNGKLPWDGIHDNNTIMSLKCKHKVVV